MTLLLLALLAADAPTYWRDVRPVLRKHCTVCHNPRQVAATEISGGVTLDTYAAVLKGTSRAWVRPGDAKGSTLHKLLVATDADRRMPLKAKPLPADDVAVIARWIDAGAKEGTPPAEAVAAPARPRKKLAVAFETAATLAATPKAPLRLTLKVGPLDPVAAVAFAPGTASHLLAVGTFGRVTLWDTRTGEIVRTFANVLGSVHDVKFSPDGALLAVAGGQASARGDLRLFRVSDGETVAVLGGHDDVVASVAFRPDGRRLASASYDKTVRLWDVPSRKVVTTLTHHSDFVTSVAWTPDGKRLLTGSKDRTARLLDADTGAGVFTFAERDEDVLAVAVRPDGKAAVVSGLQPQLTHWDATSGVRISNFNGHRGGVNELAFSADGALLASAGDDGVRTWNGKTGAAGRIVATGSPAYSVAVRGDGKLVAAGCADGTVRLIEPVLGTIRATLAAVQADRESKGVCVTSAGYVAVPADLLASGVWDAGGKVVEAAAVRKTLADAALVKKALAGEGPRAAVVGR